jgi:uncharacterized membrane protein YgaE (UPF0421/DUF939 family)
LLAPAASAVRGSARRRIDRAVSAWFAIAQTAVAAGVAWYLARLIVGQPLPFFAPASAVISLGVARGQPRRRAVELVLGVAIGIATADLLGRLIGKGAVQIGVVVGLTMLVALLVGAGTILINQAAISAVLVMTLPVTGQGAAPDRFFDALIGGGVALLLSQVLFRRDPVATVARASRPALDELVVALRETAAALVNHDLEGAERALLRARSLDDEISEFYDALAVARETAWLSPARRRARGRLALYADAARQVDYAVRNTRVLARSAAAAIRKDISVDPELAAAVAMLATAVAEFAEQLADPGRIESARRLAIGAAQRATDVLGRQNDLQTSMIVGQVRATALDLLRGSGLDAEEARAALEAGVSAPRAGQRLDAH